MFSESSELGLRIALALGLVSLAVATGLVLQVMAMRLAGVRRERRLLALRERWRPVMAQAALGEVDAVQVPALPRHEQLDVLLMWNQLQDGLRGSAHGGLNQLAARLGLHAQARRMATRGRLAERVIGLATLGHLGHAGDTDLLRSALGDAQTLVSIGAARALLQLDAAAHAPRVIDQFLQRNDWPAARLGTLLRDAGADAVAPPLTQRLLGGPLADQLRLLPLLRFAETPHAGSVLHTLVARSEDPQLLSLVLRQLRDPQALPRVRALARHADALVRSAAAVALGHIGGTEDRILLTSMMSDRDWWVRHRAAQAQLALPGASPASIETLRGVLEDRFARDALTQVVAERAMDAGAPNVLPGAAAA